MSSSESSQSSIGSFRYRLGITLFVVGWSSPLFIPLVTMLDRSPEWKATVSGALLVGIPELFSLVSIAVLGKEGFDHLKEQVFGFLKRHAFPRSVSRARYRLGLCMFLLPALASYFIHFVPHLIPGYEENRLIANLGIELLFLSSLLVLGGDFWDKIRALFIYEARADIPEPAGGGS